MMRTMLALVVWLAAVSRLWADPPMEVGSRRELFVDRALIESLTNARQQLHRLVPREVALVHDAPWEGGSSGYHNIFRDGERYRMYYRAGNLEVKDGKLVVGENRVCYAESDDGIRWRKPELGLHDFQGSKANNIVLSVGQVYDLGGSIDGPAFFRDTNPAAPADACYKAFVTSRTSPLGLLALKSADGLVWKPMQATPVITGGAFDSQNLAFWDAERGEYRAYWRTFTKGVTTDREWKPAGVRAIRTATSQDFLTWMTQADLTYVDSPVEELYTIGVFPYPRAPQFLIGFPARYVDRAGAVSTSDTAGKENTDHWPPSLRALPDAENRATRAKVSERFGSSLTEGLLMASRDGVRFHRWNEAFLPPGIERPGTWNYGHQFIAWQPVETKSDLPGAPHELSFYATEGYWQGKGSGLRRYTLRLDGFVSINAPLSGGELVTKPLTFAGDSMTLNFATSAAGDIRVEIQDANGRPIPGFTLADSHELFGDTLSRPVTWNDNPRLAKLANTPIRLRFVLRDADLFSFQFQ